MAPTPKGYALFLGIILASSLAPTFAQEKNGDEKQTIPALQAARMLPSDVIAFAEINGLGETVDLILEHPLRSEVEQLPVYQEFQKSKQFSQLRGGVLLFEAGMGMQWSEVLDSVSDQGVFIAAEPESEAVVLMIHAQDGEVLDRIRKTVFPIMRGGDAGTDNDPVQVEELGDFELYSIRDESYLVDMQDWYILGNKKELVEKIVSLHASEDSKDTLAASERFQQAFEFRPDSFLLWGYVDAATVRESGEAVELYSGKTDNILAEMLFGGIMSTLKHTDLLSFALEIQSDQVALSVEAPHEKTWAGEDRAYFFGQDGNATASAIPRTEEQVFGLTAYRDLSEMWLRAADLMTDQAVESMAQADSQLALFFSGKDFGEDILGALGPQVQLLAARQKFADSVPRPAIKLPAFGLRFEMVEPEKTIKDFRRVFQSMIGFLNVVGAMEGNPPMDMEWDREEGYEIISASFVSDLDEEEAQVAPIQYNFSPAVIFTDQVFVIASTKAFAEAMIAPATDKANLSNTSAELEASVLKSILSDNSEQLIAQNMLENGHKRDEAKSEIGLLLELLGFVQDLSLDLSVKEGKLQLQTKLMLQVGEEK